MLSAGTIFSLCAGILIGLKIYYSILQRRIRKRDILLQDQKKKLHERINQRKRMKDIIDMQGYGVVFLEKGERILPLKDGKFILVKETSPEKHFWHDLWYGSG